jgi:proline iminopeptidase
MDFAGWSSTAWRVREAPVMKTILRLLAPALVALVAGCAPQAPGASSDDPEVRGEAGKGAEAAGGAGATDADAPAGPRTTDLFHRTFGDPKNRAVIYVHGGPGGNGAIFEETVAEALAAKGNFVVTYDQRGSGRSPKATPQDFTFARFVQDLDDVIHTLGLKKPTLIGHSWGGTLSVKYMEKHPASVAGTVLVGNPIDYPDSMFNIHQRCAERYASVFAFGKREEIIGLNRKMFPNGFQPPFAFANEDVGKTMEHASTCLLDFALPPSPFGALGWVKLAASPNFELAKSFAPEPAGGLQSNEKVLDHDFRALFKSLAPRLFGIYGVEDGLLSDKQNLEIPQLIGPSHFTLVPHAGHVVFIDREDAFLDLMTRDMDALAKVP